MVTYKKESLTSLIIVSVVVFFYQYISGKIFMTSVGLGLWTFTFLLYIRRLGKTIPVLEFMLLMATSQWILGAYFAYSMNYEHFKYYMYVDEETYMNVIVPGTTAFIMGVMIFYPKLKIEHINNPIRKIANEQPYIAYFLIVIGFGVPLLSSYIPSVFNFVVYLLSNFKYVGIALLLFRENSRQKWQLLIGVMFIALVGSLKQGMFHDLLLWGALMFSFVAMALNLNFILKLAVIGSGLFFVVILQSIKTQYREFVQLTEADTETRLEVFYDLMSEKMENAGEIFTNDFLGQLNVRLNQGWIISAIIDNVPAAEPFADGQTIREAIVNSFIPRFINPNKKVAGGQDNFERFTGLPINKSSTSMGTSVIGEAYGNYGIPASWIFMFLWGVFLSLFYRMFINYGQNHPIIYFLLPIVFLQVIKAETELYVVLNHFLKSTILIFLFLWGARTFLKWDI